MQGSSECSERELSEAYRRLLEGTARDASMLVLQGCGDWSLLHHVLDSILYKSYAGLDAHSREVVSAVKLSLHKLDCHKIPYPDNVSCLKVKALIGEIEPFKKAPQKPPPKTWKLSPHEALAATAKALGVYIHRIDRLIQHQKTAPSTSSQAVN